MSFLSGGSWTSDPRERGNTARLIQERRSTRHDRLAEATLACARCDAPVLLGPGRRTLAEELRCPFCGHRGTVRDFLSLGRPTRPARVVLRIDVGGVR